MKKIEIKSHGEAFLFPSILPKKAKKTDVKGNYKIIADSETTGNHHVVENIKSNSFYSLGDRTFLVAKKPTKIECVLANRHDSIKIEPGTYEFGIQKEYDHFEQNLRNVAD